MTITEVRNHSEYAIAFAKIRKYREGFTFTLNYTAIPTPQANALKIIMRDAVKAGLIECVETGFTLDGTITDETYRRTGI